METACGSMSRRGLSVDDALEEDEHIEHLEWERDDLKERIRELETALAKAVEKLKKAGLS